MSTWVALFCPRCGRSGHPQRPSLVADLPLLVHGKSLYPPETDPARAMAIRDAIEAAAAARKAAKAQLLGRELAAKLDHALD